MKDRVKWKKLDILLYPEVHIRLYCYVGDNCIAVVDGESVAFV